jgi:hypothetical protein
MRVITVEIAAGCQSSDSGIGTSSLPSFVSINAGRSAERASPASFWIRSSAPYVPFFTSFF